MHYNSPIEWRKIGSKKDWKESGERRRDKWFRRGEPERLERRSERMSECQRQESGCAQQSHKHTAAHCSAQPPLCSLLTIRYHALKSPPAAAAEELCSTEGCLLMNSSLTESSWPSDGQRRHQNFGGGMGMRCTANLRLPEHSKDKKEGEYSVDAPLWVM